MNKFKEIRPIVLGLAIKNGKLLVGEGYDKIKDQTFYRCLGGGIEFLEKSDEALKREFKEEIGAVIVKDTVIPADDFLAVLIQFALYKVILFGEYFQSSVDVVLLKVRTFQQLS